MDDPSSIDPIQICGNMETVTNPRAPSDSPAARPRWVMLDPDVDNKVDGDTSVADAMTRAACFTSSGHSFSVSFALAPPPATSRYYCDWISGAPGDGYYDSYDDFRRQFGFGPVRHISNHFRVVAAHDDSVLIQMTTVRRGFGDHNLSDYFLYETGGAARPPSLSLLPGCYITKQYDRNKGARSVPTPSDRPRSLANESTGLLRRGEGQLQVAVAQLELTNDTAELCVLQPGGEWDLKRLPIVHHEGHGDLPRCWWPDLDAAVPVGVRFMCWVDYVNGFFLRDMAEETSPDEVLRYVPLPVPPPELNVHRDGDRPNLQYCRNLAAAAGCDDAVRFVSVAPRCCCGGHGKTSCERSRYAFNVTTWTMTLKAQGPMTWVKDGVLDCDELWQLPNYGSLPHVAPRCPIVSSDNPDTVSFVLSEAYKDKKVWLLQIDTRSKTLLSAVVLHNTSGYFLDYRVPVKLRW